jgi:hypothetical protein
MRHICPNYLSVRFKCDKCFTICSSGSHRPVLTFNIKTVARCSDNFGSNFPFPVTDTSACLRFYFFGFCRNRSFYDLNPHQRSLASCSLHIGVVEGSKSRNGCNGKRNWSSSEEFSLLGYNTVTRWKSTDVSEEHVASIIKGWEYDQQDTSMKQSASRASKSCSLIHVPRVLHGIIYQKLEFFITTALRTSNPVWSSRVSNLHE